MEEKTNGSVDIKRFAKQTEFNQSCSQLCQLTLFCPHSPVENGQLPDPANWGVADVVNYFKATGFEEQATAFQDQVSVVFTSYHVTL